jgi:hypothetical protein
VDCTAEWFSGEKWKLTVSPTAALRVDGVKARPSSPTSISWTVEDAVWDAAAAATVDGGAEEDVLLPPPPPYAWAYTGGRRAMSRA